MAVAQRLGSMEQLNDEKPEIKNPVSVSVMQ